MKKSLLLCAVSGILFYSQSSVSYALNATTLHPTSVPEKHTLDNSRVEKRVRRTSSISTETVKPKESDGNPTKPSTSKVLPETPTTRDTVSTRRGRENKSRRRPTMESSSTPPSTEESPPRPAISTRPSAQPMPPMSPVPAEPASPASSTRMPSASLRPMSMQPAPEKPAMVQLEGGRPALEQESAKPAPTIEPVPARAEKPAQIEEVHSAIEVHDGKTVTKRNVKIHDRFIAVDVRGENSTIKIIGGTVSSGFIALSASESGTIDATAITVTTPSVGLLNMNSTINLKDSTVNITGDHGTSGIVFRNAFLVPEGREARNAEEGGDKIQEKGAASKVMLTNTKLFAKNGIGIGLYGTSVNGEVNLKDSELRTDMLVRNTKNSGAHPNTLILNADHSVLEGRARTSEGNITVFTLNNKATWLLTPNKKVENNDKDPSEYALFGVDEKSYSSLSILNLQESTIVFSKPTDGRYQTLFVGSKPQQRDKAPNRTTVYSATGDAEIHLNSKWDNHSPVTEQKTDRVVIAGDVSGSTVVHINLQEVEKNKKRSNIAVIWEEGMTSVPTSTHGISLIQVSGKANEDSFKLAKNYMTMSGLPYKYVLTAYKPGTSHANQNLFGTNNSDFWDFRLQNAYVDGDKKIRALLPQVANYLVMPNALFSAGFADVNNQNMLLDNMRTTMSGPENNKKQGIFLSTYSEKVTLSSNRDPLHYGYGADVNYNALQLGIVLAALEGKDISTHFGLLGTYGKLSFAPKDMEDSEKTTLDKWSLTAYSGIQHRNGVYVNTLLSYTTLKGNVTTALIGNATKLDGTEILTASATVGQKLATGIEGLMFEPQAQLVYQDLIFDVLSDADGFEVDMGHPHQWLVRIGGRLTKNLPTTEEGNAVSFYGKLNVIRTFGDNKTIQIGDTFYLDPTGSSIESGFGVNAQFSQNIALHGDISYRKKLQKAGVSGTSFSGGISYRF